MKKQEYLASCAPELNDQTTTPGKNAKNKHFPLSIQDLPYIDERFTEPFGEEPGILENVALQAGVLTLFGTGVGLAAWLWDPLGPTPIETSLRNGTALGFLTGITAGIYSLFFHSSESPNNRAKTVSTSNIVVSFQPIKNHSDSEEILELQHTNHFSAGTSRNPGVSTHGMTKNIFLSLTLKIHF